MNIYMSDINLDIDDQIKYASELIKKGEIVAFPTETVYGIGADVYQVEAIKKIYKIKQRPQDNPLIVHISNLAQLNKLVENYSKNEKLLIKNFWPGPLTILFKKNKLVPDIVTAGSEYVAIRMPNHKISLDLINYSDTPIVAPSANPSGKPSSSHHKHVDQYFSNRIFCIKGGKSTIGLESTVISLQDKYPTILRVGMVTKSDLENVLREEFFIANINTEKALSPGMLYKHYAPNAKLFIIENIEEFIKKIDYYKFKSKLGILASQQTIQDLSLSENIVIKNLGNRDDLLEISNNLFDKLLEFDLTDVEIILAERFTDSELGKAIMDKLERASYKDK